MLNFNNKKFIKEKLETGISFLIYLAPIIYFSYERIFGEVYKFISILCLFFLLLYKKDIRFDWKKNKISLLVFLIYPLAIFVVQLIKWDWNIHEYLDRFRFLFAIPIYIYLIEKKFDYFRVIEVSLPIALISSIVTTKYLFLDMQYGVNRFTDLFLHPNYYSEISLSMSLLLFTTFFISNNKSLIINLLKFLGICAGIYISIKTESRTGWINFFIIPIILIWLNRYRINKNYLFIIPLVLVLISIFLFKFNNDVNTRIYQAYIEAKDYSWSGGIAPDTSVGQRITFYRIGWYLINHEPFYGWGQKGFEQVLSQSELTSFATKYTLQYVYLTHFHNELLTLIVWYGVFGLLIYFLCFIVPLIKATISYNLISTDNRIRKNSLILIMFITTQIFSGFSDMVILFKYMVMFYSFMMACMLASISEKK